MRTNPKSARFLVVLIDGKGWYAIEERKIVNPIDARVNQVVWKEGPFETESEARDAIRKRED